MFKCICSVTSESKKRFSTSSIDLEESSIPLVSWYENGVGIKSLSASVVT